MFKQHHSEKALSYPFNTARISMMLSAMIISPDALCMVSQNSVLLVSCFDSPFGIGKLAIEHIVRAANSQDFSDLLEAYESWAREKGCVSISLSCTDRHQAFARLYGRRGFTLAETTFAKAL